MLQIPKRGFVSSAASFVVLFALGCQGAGGGKADPAACDDFAAKVCEKAGEKTATCESAKSAAQILTPPACSVALGSIDETIAKAKSQRAVCDQLVERLCADVGKDTESCAMVAKKTQSFPIQRCEQMTGQYPQVLAQLKQMEQSNQPLAVEMQAVIAAKGAPAFGAEEAKVTVVEFSDFECPYCSKTAGVTKEIKKKYSENVRVVFRHFPLSFHKKAHFAAQASLAAHAQGKFWEYHDLVFENQDKLDRESLESHAKKLGLEMAAFRKALDAGTYKKAVDIDFKLGESVAVSGTPTLFVNGKRVQNPTDFAAVSKAIDAAM